MAVVHGEAGIGKTSLVHALLDQTGTVAMIGRCDDATVPVPLGPFRDIFRAAGSPDRGDPDGARQEIVRLLDRTPVMVFEDIHWADEATFDLLTHIGKRIADHRAVLVLTHRPDGPPELARCIAQIPAERLTDIELRPLSRETVVAWSEEHDRDGAAVFAKTGGNPFLVGELLASPPGEIPNRISTSTLARLATLTQPARAMAELLAHFPGGAPWPIIERLRPNQDRAIGDLERHRWVETRGDRVWLRHELIREAIVESQGAAGRRTLNNEILGALIQHDADPAAIAHHAVEAGDDQRSVDFAIVAAEQMSRAGAHRDALRLLERVAHLQNLLDEGEQAHFSEALGLERMAADQLDEACAALTDAADQWMAIGDLEAAARTLREASGAEWRRGAVQRSDELLQDAYEVLDGTDHRSERFRVQVTMAQNAGLTSQWRRAMDVVSAALEDDRHLSPRSVAAAVAIRADARRLLGDETGALTDYERSLELAGPDAPHVRTALTNRVATSLAVLDPIAAKNHLDEAIAATADRRSDWLDRTVAGLRGGVAFLRGDWDEALNHLDEQLSDPLATRTRPALIAGLVRTRRGDLTGVDLIEDAHRRAASLEDIQRLGGTAAAMAELLWLNLVPEDVAEDILEVTRLAHRSGHARYSSELALWCRRLGLGGGDANPAGPPGFLLELEGDSPGAATEWSNRGVPYLQLLAMGFGTKADAIRTAIDRASAFGASTVVDRLRARLREMGHRVQRGRSRASLDNPGGLTNRQVDVVRLIASGLTNQQIAERLFISRKTVDHHVSAILTTLGASDRAEAGDWAHNAGLT